MRKILTALMTASLLLPTTTLASSIRPGSVTHKTRIQKSRQPSCLIDKKWEPCDIIIDDTGVKGPEGHITNVVQWTTEEKDFNYGEQLLVVLLVQE